MTEVRLGDTATLVAQFYDVPGGTAVDVTGLQLTITALDGSAVLGPFGLPPVVHAGLGVYSYPFTPSLSLIPGDYLASWNANEADASEVLQVLPVAAGGLSIGPCTDWPVVSCSLFPASTAEVSGFAIQAAQEVLYNKSGQQFGTCQITLRPCRKDCWGRSWPWMWLDPVSMNWGVQAGWPFPYLYAGNWYNLGCGGCPGSCSCTVLEQVQLPEETVSIDEVRIDGSVLAPSSYMMYDHRLLIRTDGGRWPLCNDLSQPDTASGTWSITLTYGVEVPVLGQMAMRELAVEIAKACVGDSSCRLGATVQQLTRQGVSQTFFDPNMMFADGKLGLRLCDMFLGTVNPHNLRERARVYDPDNLGPWRQT